MQGFNRKRRDERWLQRRDLSTSGALNVCRKRGAFLRSYLSRWAEKDECHKKKGFGRGLVLLSVLDGAKSSV